MPMPTLSTAVLHESTRRWGTALMLGWDKYTKINIYRDFSDFLLIHSSRTRSPSLLSTNIPSPEDESFSSPYLVLQYPCLLALVVVVRWTSSLRPTSVVQGGSNMRLHQHFGKRIL